MKWICALKWKICQISDFYMESHGRNASLLIGIAYGAFD